MYIPVGLIIIGIVALIERARRPRPAPRREPYEGPQIVGQTCIQCRETIAVFFDAQWCKHCNGAVHNDCLATHLAPVVGPYR